MYVYSSLSVSLPFYCGVCAGVGLCLLKMCLYSFFFSMCLMFFLEDSVHLFILLTQPVEWFFKILNHIFFILLSEYV